MPVEQRWKDIGVSIPSLLPLQAVPQEWEEPKILEYLQSLHNYLREDRQKVVRAINVLSRYRLLVTDAENFPDATGDGTVIVDEDDGTIFVDPIPPTTGTTPPAWQPIVPEYNTITQEPTGFLDSNNDCTIGISGTDFFIEPTGDSFIFYSGGIKYEVDSQLTLDLSGLTSEGNSFIYFDGQTGALTLDESVTFEDIIRDNVFVAELYHDGTSLQFMMDERHGLMPWQSHLHAHLADGTVWRSGLGLTGMSMDGTGNLDSDAEADPQTGEVMDEDIVIELPTVSPGDWDLLYLESGAWKFENGGGGTAPVKQLLGVPHFNNVSTPGSEALQAVTNNKFFLMHIFATNIVQDGTGAAVSGHVAILGQNEYATKTAARSAANTEISSIVTGSLPMPEFLPYATIIYQAKGSNTWGAAAVTTDLGEDYVNWLGAEIQPGNPPSSHANLTNRDLSDQHPATAISLVTTDFDGILSATEDEVQAALDKLDDGAVNKLGDTMTGNLTITSAATPAITLNETATTNDYTSLRNIGLGYTYLSQNSPAGVSANIQLDMVPADGSSNALLRLFRATSTTGSRRIDVFVGDGTSTINHQIIANSNANFCKTGGSLMQNGVAVSLTGHTHSYLLLAGGTMTGDIKLASGVSLDTSADHDLTLKRNGTLKLTIGANTSELATPLRINGGLATEISVWDGTSSWLAGLGGGAGGVSVGDDNVPLSLEGSRVDLGGPLYLNDNAIVCLVRNDTGAQINKGSCGYVSSDYFGIPSLTLTDADAAATATGKIYMAAENIANGSTGYATVMGEVSGFTGLTVGGIVYLGTGAGGRTQTAPSGSGDIVRVIGHAISSTIIFFDPSNSWVELA